MRDERGWVVRRGHVLASRAICKACRYYSLWKGPKEPHWVCQPRFPLGDETVILAEGDPVPTGCKFFVEHVVSERKP
jgi:hypothetical protein